MVYSSKGNPRTGGGPTIEASRVPRSFGMRDFKIYSGVEKGGTGRVVSGGVSRINVEKQIKEARKSMPVLAAGKSSRTNTTANRSTANSRNSEAKPPFAGRKLVPVFATGRSSDTHSLSNDSKVKVKATKKDLGKCGRKALADVSNVKIARLERQRGLADSTNLKTTTKNYRKLMADKDTNSFGKGKPDVLHSKGHTIRSTHASTVSLAKNANLSSKRLPGLLVKGKDSAACFAMPNVTSDKKDFPSKTCARNDSKIQTSDVSQFRLLLATKKTMYETNNSSKQAIRFSKQVPNKTKATSASRHTATIKSFCSKKLSTNTNGELKISSSFKGSAPATAEELSLDKDQPVATVSSDGNTSSNTCATRRQRQRRKSYTSQLLGTYDNFNVVDNVQDIDDKGNPLEVAVYVDDIHNYYWTMELQNPLPRDYLKNQKDITPIMRSVLVDWMIEVHYKFDLMQETLFLTINLLDRALCFVSVERDKLQLLGLTVLLLASKYEDFWHPRIKDLLSISVETYSRKDILTMEKLVLANLRFRLNLPTPYVFMSRFLKAAQANKKLEDLSFYLIELCLAKYEAMEYKPSLLCASAVYVARHTLKISPAWSEILKKHAHYDKSELRLCSQMILRFQKAASSARLKNTYRKFLKPEHSCVAGIKALERLP